MTSENIDVGWEPTFYVGQHESSRAFVTEAVLQKAHEAKYDMLTSPITNAHFRERVLSLLSLSRLEDEVQPESSREAVDPLSIKIPPLTNEDTHLAPGSITSQLLAMVSSWIDLCSPDPLVAEISRQVLLLEVGYAAFCGIAYVFLPGPRLHHTGRLTNGLPLYARAVLEACMTGSHLDVFVMLPMVDHPDDGNDRDWPMDQCTSRHHLETLDLERQPKADVFGSWDAWNVVRTMCKYAPRLFVALGLPPSMPPLSIQSRWRCEPIHLIYLTTDTFKPNPKGYPALPQTTQSFITQLMRMKTPPWILLCDIGPIPGVPHDPSNMLNGPSTPTPIFDAAFSPSPAEASSISYKSPRRTDPTPHLSYVHDLRRKQPPRSQVEQYGHGYQDYLQVPLQPQTDNLESLTYEVFEIDPVKYDQYEKAIRLALRDWKDENRPGSGPDGRVVVAVAGAGRGPLVRRALKASEAEDVAIDMWAVEKNPNAFVLLQQHNAKDWGGRVTVVQSDMRSWKGPDRSTGLDQPSDNNDEASYPVDILISELLGSFADNELSPECLDGICHLLNPSYGISIPASYTAFLTPVAAPKLHADISSRATYDTTAPETPAVVWLHAIDFLSLAPAPTQTQPPPLSSSTSQPESPSTSKTSMPTPDRGVPKAPIPFTAPLAPQPLVLSTWTFTHGPQPAPRSTSLSSPFSNTHNTRFASLEFRTRDRGVCHGLAGYFECLLYESREGEGTERVELSTNPCTMAQKSAEMISWFPMFFPLKTPLYLPDNALLQTTIWRQTDSRKVWYEWMVESYGWNLMVGGGKKRVRLGGGELMSSFKGGCLM